MSLLSGKSKRSSPIYILAVDLDSACLGKRLNYILVALLSSEIKRVVFMLALEVISLILNLAVDLDIAPLKKQLNCVLVSSLSG